MTTEYIDLIKTTKEGNEAGHLPSVHQEVCHIYDPGPVHLRDGTHSVKTQYPKV